MSLLRYIILTLAVACCYNVAHAQVSEIGLTVGGTYYIGDLNPSKHFNKYTKLGVGLVYKYNFNNRYAFRLMGLYGRLEAYDSALDDPVLVERNLHFRANVWEASGVVEINFFEYRGGKNAKSFTPYVFAGLGYFRADPRAKIDDSWFDLQPLGTEGQGTTQSGEDKYKLDHMNLPFGAGFKINLGRVDMSLSWGLRRTWTDYIDDVSGNYVDNDILSLENGPLAAVAADRNISGSLKPEGVARGDAQTRDWYVYTGFTMTYLIGPRFMECWEINQGFK
jgi:hypothetical protein